MERTLFEKYVSKAVQIMIDKKQVKYVFFRITVIMYVRTEHGEQVYITPFSLELSRNGKIILVGINKGSEISETLKSMSFIETRRIEIVNHILNSVNASSSIEYTPHHVDTYMHTLIVNDIIDGDHVFSAIDRHSTRHFDKTFKYFPLLVKHDSSDEMPKLRRLDKVLFVEYSDRSRKTTCETVYFKVKFTTRFSLSHQPTCDRSRPVRETKKDSLKNRLVNEVVSDLRKMVKPMSSRKPVPLVTVKRTPEYIPESKSSPQKGHANSPVTGVPPGMSYTHMASAFTRSRL
jgi:hypothetical protein